MDPFHPEAAGTRVPSLLPRDTATFNTYSQIDLGAPLTGQSHLIIASYEKSTKVQFMKMTTPDSIYQNTPTPFSAKLGEGGETYSGHMIALGTIADINLEIFTDETPNDVFTKHRVVTTGMRFFKTPASDSESG